MRETRLSGSEGGGAKPIASPYPYLHFAPLALQTRQRWSVDFFLEPLACEGLVSHGLFAS